MDIGCGPGYLLCAARERGWKVRGLEINDQSARFAREVNKVEVDVGWIEAYAEEWAARLDAVHFNQVLEHVHDPVGFLSGVRSVLKPDGAFFCGIPNEDSIMNRVAQAYFKLQGSAFTEMLAPTFPPYHVLGFSPRTIQRILEKTGFRVVRIEHVNYCQVDFQAFVQGQPLKGFKGMIGSLCKLFGHGHGMDVYGVPA